MTGAARRAAPDVVGDGVDEGVGEGVDEVVVRLTRASVGYGDVPVVRDIDLEVRRGEAVVVLGSNGSGKTTLVRGLLGLASVLSGDVDVLGAPVGHLRDRGRVGYVPQRHTVTGAVPATVREVVAVGRLPRLGLWRRPGKADRQAVQHAVDAVGLLDRVDDPVGTLSGGQQRRVLVARSLAAEPELLVMDEPTAGVDASNQEALAAVLGRLSRAGTTLLVVTHEVGPLEDVVGREVVLDHGHVVADRPRLPGARTGAGTADHGVGGGHHHPGEPTGPAGPYRLDHPVLDVRPGGTRDGG